MKDYSHLGIDPRGRKIGSLGSRYEYNADGKMVRKKDNFTGAYDFDAQMDKGIITTPKVRKLNFGVLQGGTCNLGGTLDGDGVLSVAEEGGTEIVRLDKNGITVNHGSITVKDTAGSSVIDSLGLVSLNAFSQGSAIVTGGVGQMINNTSYTLITAGEGYEGSTSFTLNRQSSVMFFGQVTYMNTHMDSADWTGNTYLAIFVDDNEKSTFREGHFQVTNGDYYQDGHAGQYNTAFFHHMEVLGTGTHKFELKGKIAVTSGSPSFAVDAYSMSYMVLGK